MTGNCTAQPPHLNGPHLWNYIVKRNPHTHTVETYANTSITALREEYSYKRNGHTEIMKWVTLLVSTNAIYQHKE